MTNFRKQFLPQFEMDTIQLCNMFHALKNRVFNFNRPETDNQRFVIVLHLKVDYFDLDRKKRLICLTEIILKYARIWWLNVLSCSVNGEPSVL